MKLKQTELLAVFLKHPLSHVMALDTEGQVDQLLLHPVTAGHLTDGYKKAASIHLLSWLEYSATQLQLRVSIKNI